MLEKYYNKTFLEAGIDEAGRGCLAGPVVAAAVILPTTFYHPLLNDSKKMKHEDRIIVKKYIEHNAIAFAVKVIDNDVVDEINIMQATMLAMHQSILALTIQPEFLLIDGNYFKPYKNIQHKCIVKGDSIFASIAAASILAKTYRDEYMQLLHTEFPNFGWDSNKGYGTLKHVKALRQFGRTKFHRKTFKYPA